MPKATLENVATIYVPVTNEMLDELAQGREVGFEVQDVAVRIKLSPTFAPCEVELKEARS